MKWHILSTNGGEDILQRFVFCYFFANFALSTVMIKTENIKKSFGNVEVLKGINLNIRRGDITAIVGASGAGKSTLLQIIGTLLSPDSGKVWFGGKDVTGLKGNGLAKFRNSSIGFVFQNHRLLPEFTIEENVMMPALIARQNHSKARKSAQELLEMLGLGDRLSHRPSALSGGECQRAAVARALINRPLAILADEPTGSLDSANRARLHKLFFELRDRLEATFVIVTHDSNLARDCDNIITLADGKVV